MNSIGRIFARALLTLIPIVLTLYIVTEVIRILESFVGSFLWLFFPESAYIPGIGFILSLILIYLFGLILNNYLAIRFVQLFENQIMKVPFLKAIYSPLRDLMHLFAKKDPSQMGQPVLVTLSDSNIKLFGVVTREGFDDIKLGVNLEDSVTVYIPLSYALGGYTLIVKKSQLQKVDLPMDKAMSLAITGWIKGQADNKN